MTMIEYLWFYILPFVGVVMLIVTPVFFFLLWFRYLTPIAKKINRYVRKKMAIAAITFDTGKTVLCGLIERRGEGVVITDYGRYKILPRMPVVKKEEKDSLTELYSDLVLKRSILEGTNSPFFIGYSGKICLLNPDTLALAEMTEHQSLKEGEVVFEGEGAEENREGEEKPRSLLLLDPRKIKELVTKSFSESQMLAIIRDTEEIMRASMGLRRFTVPIAVIIVIVLLLMVAMQFFGGGGIKPA